MTIFDRGADGGQPPPPAGWLAGWLAASLLVACLPQPVSLKIKDHGRTWLAPGQRIAQAALTELAYWRRAWQYDVAAAAELAALRDRVRRQEEQNDSLRFLAAAGLRPGLPTELRPGLPTGPLPAFAPLILARTIETRVLGQQAQAFLQSCAIVSRETAAELSVGSLALDCGAAVVDQGENASLAAGDLALAGQRIWGRLIEVGPQTAVVRRVNAAGFRGLVRVAHAVEGGWKTLARGVLEGTGEDDCRIRLVEATAPVAVGDRVFAAEEQGVVRAPLMYGRIARLALAPGAAHWQIWMRPAVDDEPPDRLLVLQPAANPARGLTKR